MIGINNYSDDICQLRFWNL